MCPLENKIGCIPHLEKEYFFFQMVNFQSGNKIKRDPISIIGKVFPKKNIINLLLLKMEGEILDSKSVFY